MENPLRDSEYRQSHTRHQEKGTLEDLGYIHFTLKLLNPTESYPK